MSLDLYSQDAFQLYVRPLSEVAEEQQNLAREKLDSFLKSEFPVGEFPRVLLSGDAAIQIAQLARANGFDLIIMPTHAGVFRMTLLGSTTAKVLNHADCAVLTTQHAEAISPRQLEHREWVCAIDLNGDSKRVLRYASQAAESVHANLTLIHVISASAAELPVQLDLEGRLQSAKREAASRCIEELQKAGGTHAFTSVVIGPIKNMLTDEARRLRADVLVVGRGPQSGVLGRLRDLTYAVVREAPCPVLSV
ncbi:MAG TPA: universal stress protein [Candidatus Acidoferrum sp.]|nr:universal stress protein [Candidatus Acidoferrum sp.]